MAMAFDWNMPVALRFGAGCSDGLAAALAGRRAVVMAFEPAEGVGLRARWQAALGASLQAWVPVADGLSSLARARDLSVRVWPALDDDTVLIGVGGGTTLDLAKLLRGRPVDAGFDAVAAALRGTGAWPALRIAPLWLLPTTAGTGSEVTRWATVWDTEAEPQRKLSFDEAWGYADRAFVDPLLAISCPAEVTRDAALDTLAHALESLWNHHANALSTTLAVAAARSVIEHLPALLERPADAALRAHLAQAACQAGLAFSQTRTALAHALSYDLTLQQGVPHGLACALWLPTAWQLALGRDRRTDAALAEVFGIPAEAGLERLHHWLQALGIDATPAGLAARGIADAPQRVQAALASPRGRNFIAAA